MNEVENFELSLPSSRRAKIELWKYVNADELEAMLACFIQRESDSSDEINSSDYNKAEYDAFCGFMNKKFKWDAKASRRHAILVDKYYHLVKFAMRKVFNKLQINALVFIVMKVHEMATSTAFGNIDETHEYLRDMLLLYSVNRPPFSVELFSPVQIKQILDYMLATYFRNFKLYKLIFTPAIKMDIKFGYTNLKSVEMDTMIDEPVDEEKSDEEHTLNKQESEEVFDENLSAAGQNFADLRQFIRKYLGDEVGKVKKDIESALLQSQNEIAKSIPSAGSNQRKDAKSARKK